MKPSWLKVTLKDSVDPLRSCGMVTVCQEARCPNLSSCWNSGTATFMLLGKVCTRSCRFCAIQSSSHGTLIDAEESKRLVASVAALGLSYVVLTMVTRDDLLDGGAAHIASCVATLKKSLPSVRVEVLISDFAGSPSALDTLVRSGVDVVAHNIETVQRLQQTVRDRRASYAQSLFVLKYLASLNVCTKSSLMLGLGETFDEVRETLSDLRAVGCRLLTLGQYLQPSPRQLPVVSFLSPEDFLHLETDALRLGFEGVASGPLVRSSYKAKELFSSLEVSHGI